MDGVESFQTSSAAPETHKRCLSVILRNILLDRAGRSTADPWHLSEDSLPKLFCASTKSEKPFSYLM